MKRKIKKRLRRLLRKFNRWFWDDGMVWLQVTILLAVFITWIAYALFEKVRYWFNT